MQQVQRRRASSLRPGTARNSMSAEAPTGRAWCARLAAAGCRRERWVATPAGSDGPALRRRHASRRATANRAANRLGSARTRPASDPAPPARSKLRVRRLCSVPPPAKPSSIAAILEHIDCCPPTAPLCSSNSPRIHPAPGSSVAQPDSLKPRATDGAPAGNGKSGFPRPRGVMYATALPCLRPLPAGPR